MEILKEILKKNIKIGIVTNEPPAPNKPKSKPDKIKKIYPIIISIYFFKYLKQTSINNCMLKSNNKLITIK